MQLPFSQIQGPAGLSIICNGDDLRLPLEAQKISVITCNFKSEQSVVIRMFKSNEYSADENNLAIREICFD